MAELQIPVGSMTTLEIAELTGKGHFHVLRDARDLLVEMHGEERLPEFEGSYGRQGIGETTIPTLVYLLPRRETLALTSGYSLTLRLAIIDKVTELERSLRFTRPFITEEMLADAVGLKANQTLHSKLNLAAQHLIRCGVGKDCYKDPVNYQLSFTREGAASALLFIRQKHLHDPTAGNNLGALRSPQEQIEYLQAEALRLKGGTTK